MSMPIHAPLGDVRLAHAFGGQLGSVGGRLLPKANLLSYNKNVFNPTTLKFLDTVGISERPLYPLQYIQADGTGYFVNSDMVTAGRTITSTTKNGTTTLSSPSAGRLNATSGTLWDFTVTWSDAVVSTYRFCSKTAANAGIAYDVSGAGRHLTATGFSNIDNVCGSGRDYGSDALNLYGFTKTSFAPIPARTDNPTLDALGNALTYPGRAKYSIVPKGRTGNCATFSASSNNIDIGQIPSQPDSSERIEFYYKSTGSTVAWGRLFYIGQKSNGNCFLLSRNDTSTGIQIRLDASGQPSQYVTSATSVLFDGSVHKITVTLSGSLCNVYIDDVLHMTSNTLVRSTGLIGRYSVVGGYDNTTIRSHSGLYYNFNVNGRNFPLTEGAGTIVFGYDNTGQTYTGTITASDINAFWAGKQSTFFPELQYGYRLSGSTYIPSNPYTGLACDGNALSAQPLKFSAASNYSLPDAHQPREATGWTYGTANTFYNADGTQKELTFAELDAAGTGPRYYLGTKGTALYSTDQTAKDSLIEKILKV